MFLLLLYTAIICPNLTIPTKALLSTTHRLFDSIVNVTCDSNHHLIDFKRSVYQQSTYLLVFLFLLYTAIICPNLTIPTKASLSTTNRLFDSIVNVTCDTGHYYNVTSMEQVRTSHCLENGAWDQVTTQPCLRMFT